MGNAINTGTVDLSTLEVTSSDKAQPKFRTPLVGDLRLNGVRVPLRAETVDDIVKTINRFTPQTNVTASIGTGSSKPTTAGSSVPGKKHLVLTSPEQMRFDGDSSISGSLGLVGGLTLAST